MYPPVDTVFYRPEPARGPESFFLVVSALVPYKRLDIAVRACAQMKMPLTIVGQGPERGRLRQLAETLAADVTFAGWLEDAQIRELYRRCTAVLMPGVEDFGMVPVEVSLPNWPYDSLDIILFAEATAAFEDLTLSHKVDELKVQVPDAWPNTFRQSRFLSAVDFVQSDRFRRKVAVEMARVFSKVDLLLVPSLRDEMLTITNFTGHPSLTLRAGFFNVSEARSDWAPDPAHPLPKFSPPRRVPHGVTLIGRLFDEGTIARAGLALERSLAVADERPPGF